jgi:hypothetical protein
VVPRPSRKSVTDFARAPDQSSMGCPIPRFEFIEALEEAI